MSDYIKREDALDMHFSVGLQDDSMLYVRYAEVKNNIKHIPSADVVEVVRCKDCKYGEWEVSEINGETKGFQCALHCLFNEDGFNDEGYCCLGKKK